MKKIFGQRLKNLRIKNDELQSDLAKILNVDVSMVSLWENGKNYPEVKKLIDIALHYNVSTDYLLGIENETGAKTYINNSFNKFNNKGNFKI